MDFESLVDRRGHLEASLKNIEQSFHIVTGHIAEVNYQIKELSKPLDSPENETQVEQVIENVIE